MPVMDPLPGEPCEHMDVLLGFLVPFAKQALERNDGFSPFGASMAPDGELQAVGGYEGAGEPTAAEVFELIVHGLRERAKQGALLATGVCVDVQLTEQEFPLGVRVELEHRDGDPITCVLPYRRGDDGYEFGEMLAFEGERSTFA
ncbi:MAG TPA: hypothetical protein VGR41_02290 [Actinomycetota bacterium]|nr:hypothetical protein [Actinomycetota bacterium]